MGVIRLTDEQSHGMACPSHRQMNLSQRGRVEERTNLRPAASGKQAREKAEVFEACLIFTTTFMTAS